MNVVAGPGSDVRRSGSSSTPDVAKIAFTGSTEVGRSIAAGRGRHDQAGDARARRQVGRTSCSPTPTSSAAAAAAPGAVFGNAGQDCCARSRILVQRSALDAFLDALERRGGQGSASATRSTRHTQMGPLISASQRETVASFLADDAPVAIRGAAPEGPGYWFPPTVLCPGRSNADRAAARGDLRTGRVRDPVRRRGGGGRAGQRHHLRAVGLDLDARRRRARCGSPARSRPACCRSTPTPRSGWRRRSAASSSRATAASSGPHALDAYTEVKSIYYATELMAARSRTRSA